MPRPLTIRLLLPAVFLSVTAFAHSQSSIPSLDSSGSSAVSPDPGDAAPTSLPAGSLRDNFVGPIKDSPLPSASGTLAFSASSIISLLEENPDLMVELKAFAADRMQQQGSQIDANDISDEMLYQQIETNAGLRSAITTFLRARGYSAPYGSESTAEIDPFVVPRDSRINQLPDGMVTTDKRPRLAGESSLSQAQTSPAQRSVDNKREAPAPTSVDTPSVLRQPTPYNLRSLRDLYTQIPDSQSKLKRFGSDVFTDHSALLTRRTASEFTAPLDTPIDPEYVLGPGDTLEIDLWGSTTQRLTRSVTPDGRILLPEAGSITVAGMTLRTSQESIAKALGPQFRDAKVSVTLARLRSVHVYIVGDVQRPGGYQISALSTPISALYAAGGPTASGSLRIARHMRNGKLLEEVDLYDFLLRGVPNGSERFESGDTLLIPSAGPLIAISGAIRRPAIYELKAGGSAFSKVLEDAGGLLPSADSQHIVLDRIGSNGQRVTLSIPTTALDKQHESAFALQDGDRIRIASIPSYSEQAIYLDGHVLRPGRVSFHDGMRLSDVLHSYRDLLPEPADQGQIIRLVPPDLHPEALAFSVRDILTGNSVLDLAPYDTIRIFSRYEVDAPRVTISGEVLHPGSYPLAAGMTAGQLVRMAGGFKRSALLDSADLTSYTVVDGHRILSKLTAIKIGAIVQGESARDDVALKPGDVLAIHQITGWNDIGQSVTIEGQVQFPGIYGFQEGERLSSVLLRAGGLLPSAYPAGAVLVRDQVREVEEKSREELIRQIQANAAAARLSPNVAAGDASATLQLIKTQQDQVLADLKNHPPVGRMVIHVDRDIEQWANTPADIELRRGDVLTVPKQPGFVVVTGQVYNATALAFTPGKSASWYLNHAGGTNTTADRKEIFIVRANGSVVGRHSYGHFGGDVLSTKLGPGDVVVVPQKILGKSQLWRNLLSTAQIASSIAITASVAAI